MIEAAWIGALAGLVTAGVVGVSFWMSLSERITKAQARAEAAEMKADNAQREADNVQTQIGVMVGQFSVFREHVAKEYIDRDALAALEKRIMDGLRELGLRLERAINKQVG